MALIATQFSLNTIAVVQAQLEQLATCSEAAQNQFMMVHNGVAAYEGGPITEYARITGAEDLRFLALFMRYISNPAFALVIPGMITPPDELNVEAIETLPERILLLSGELCYGYRRCASGHPFQYYQFASQPLNDMPLLWPLD